MDLKCIVKRQTQTLEFLLLFIFLALIGCDRGSPQKSDPQTPYIKLEHDRIYLGLQPKSYSYTKFGKGLVETHWEILQSSSNIAPTFNLDKTIEYRETDNMFRDEMTLTFFEYGSYKAKATIGGLEDTINFAVIPKVDAGSDLQVQPFTVIPLMGNVAPTDDGTSVEWSQLSGPSPLSLPQSNSNALSFIATTIGTYELNFKVKGFISGYNELGEYLSVSELSDTVKIVVVTSGTTSTNLPPIANAGSDNQVESGDSITLSAYLSSDPENDPLSYYWVITKQPSSSNPTLSLSNSANPTLVTDLLGEYEISLVVNDGTNNSVADTVIVTVVPKIIDISLQIEALKTMLAGNFFFVTDEANPNTLLEIFEFGSYGENLIFSSMSAQSYNRIRQTSSWDVINASGHAVATQQTMFASRLLNYGGVATEAATQITMPGYTSYPFLGDDRVETWQKIRSVSTENFTGKILSLNGYTTFPRYEFSAGTTAKEGTYFDELETSHKFTWEIHTSGKKMVIQFTDGKTSEFYVLMKNGLTTQNDVVIFTFGDDKLLPLDANVQSWKFE